MIPVGSARAQVERAVEFMAESIRFFGQGHSPCIAETAFYCALDCTESGCRYASLNAFAYGLVQISSGTVSYLERHAINIRIWVSRYADPRGRQHRFEEAIVVEDDYMILLLCR